MTRESKYSSEQNKSLWRFTANSEQECRKQGGVPSGAVSFVDGETVFTTDGKITVSKTIRDIKSIRLITNLDTTTEDILQLSSSSGVGGWVSPTGKEDDAWSDAANIYDGNILTSGAESTNGQSVTLTIASTSCSKIRINAGLVAGGATNLKIEVYYSGSFHQIHSGLLTEDTWQEIAVGSTEDITKVKLTTNTGINSEVWELELWNASSGSRSIEAVTGTLTATGVTTPTIYINGSAGSTIGTGKSEIVVTTATAFDADDIILGYISAYLEGKIDYIEFWNYTLTAEEVSNFYSGKRNRAFTSPDEVLSVSSNSGSVVSKYDEPTITDIAYVKEAELIAAKFNRATTMIDLGLISDTMIGNITAMAWIKPHTVGEGGAGRIVSNGKFVFSLTSNYTKQVFISSDNGATWKYSANDIWATDKWCHIIVTRTAAGVTNIYRNLVLSGAADETSGTPVVPTEKTIVGNSYTGGNTIDGLLGEVRVFKGILTANQRDQIYQQDRHLYNV